MEIISINHHSSLIKQNNGMLNIRIPIDGFFTTFIEVRIKLIRNKHSDVSLDSNNATPFYHITHYIQL